MTKQYKTTAFDLDRIRVQVVRKPIKNLILRVYSPDEVKLSAPLRLSNQAIADYLWSKQAWIQLQCQRLAAIPRMINHESILLWGEVYPYTQHLTPRRMYITQDEQGIHGFFPQHATLATRQRVLHAWLRQQLMEGLPALIQHWQTIIGVEVREWGIKAMKTRWGSCNPRAQRIWLNLQLIHKPPACLQAVLVHELVHLLEPSHNSRFYALMTQFLPEWRACQNYLK